MEEDFEGIQIDSPVGSIRMGRGRGGGAGETDAEFDEEYWRVRRRVRRVLAFYRHLATYISVNLVLLAFDLIFDPDDFWVQWVAAIWGIILVLHFLNVFAFDAVIGREAERRMIESELRKRRSGGAK